MEVSTTNPVLDRLLEAAGVRTDSEFARFLGKSPQAISKVRASGKTPRHWVTLVAEKFNISTDRLFFGEDRAQQVEKMAPDALPVLAVAPSSLLNEEFALIPLVAARLSAGCGCDLTSAKVEKMYSFRLDFLQRRGNPKDMVLMHVSGRSMEPEIWDGDIALLDTSKKNIAPEKLLAVRYEDEIYVKRVEKRPDGVILKSVNPDYSPNFLALNDNTTDNFDVLGRVIWIGREYR